jgi:hypothetical protein
VAGGGRVCRGTARMGTRKNTQTQLLKMSTPGVLYSTRASVGACAPPRLGTDMSQQRSAPRQCVGVRTALRRTVKAGTHVGTPGVLIGYSRRTVRGTGGVCSTRFGYGHVTAAQRVGVISQVLGHMGFRFVEAQVAVLTGVLTGLLTWVLTWVVEAAREHVLLLCRAGSIALRTATCVGREGY